MAYVTKYTLVEQIRSLLGGGGAKAGANYEPQMIAAHLQQAVNRHMRFEHMSVTLPGDETIPEGLVLAIYDAVPVEKYKGLSRARLPITPISLRRNMGVFFVGPSVINAILEGLSLNVTGVSSSQIDAVWNYIPGATYYLLERATDAEFTIELMEVYSGDAINFSDTGLPANTGYYYRVSAHASGYTTSDYAYSDDNTLGFMVLAEDGTFILNETGGRILEEINP
jgi:hypothetical protein